MNTILLDANIILRYLTNDLPEQASKVEKYLQRAEKKELELHVTREILVEVIFHLQRWYKINKEVAAEKLMIFVSPEWINIDKKKQIFESLSLYKYQNIDFVDLLIWSKAKDDNMKVLTFDKHFDKLQPNLRIEP